MAIKAGDKMPDGKFRVMTATGPAEVSTDELFKGKTVVLFAVPGAFTPTCSNQHLPSYLKNYDKGTRLASFGLISPVLTYSSVTSSHTYFVISHLHFIRVYFLLFVM